MTRLTVCPHFLLEYPKSSPTDIERTIIVPLNRCLAVASEHGVKIVIDKDILDLFNKDYPWNLTADPEWRGPLNLWHTLITQKIAKKCEILYCSDDTTTNNNSCAHLSARTNTLFSRFLAHFASKDLPNNLSQEGVFVSDSCTNEQHYEGCYLLTDPLKINHVSFPWLRIYNSQLPPTGKFPFVPPSRWKQYAVPRRGNKHGYIDVKGNEWQWDKLHKNHWDVQHGSSHTNVSPNRSSHTNVSPNGDIL